MDKVPFHPLVARWFSERFREPTAPQAAGWKHIAAVRTDGQLKLFVNGKLVAESIDMRTRAQFRDMLAEAGLK